MGAGIAAGPHCPRSQRFCRSLASRRGSGSGRGLSAPVGSLSGSLPKPKLLPGSQGDPPKQASMGPFPGRRQSELCRSPESQMSNRSPAPASFRSPQKRTSPGPDPDRLRSELRRRSFRGSIARRPGFRWTPLRESGVGIGPKTSASRFFRGAPGLSFHDIPEGPSLPLSAASGIWSLRFRRNRLAGCPIGMRVPTDSRQPILPVDNEDNGDKSAREKARGRPSAGFALPGSGV